MVSHPWNDYTFAEYVALEKSQVDGIKHEFVEGEIFARAGGTARHAALGAELVGQWRAQLSPPCRVFSSDLWIGSLKTAMTTYADASVVCGPLEKHPSEPNIVVNPRVVAEVTSQSSEKKDRGAKLAHYQRMASVEAVVIVSHRERRVDVHRRSGGSWTVQTAVDGRLEVIDGLGIESAGTPPYFAQESDTNSGGSSSSQSPGDMSGNATPDDSPDSTPTGDPSRSSAGR